MTVAGLRNYYNTVSIIILGYTLSTYKKKSLLNNGMLRFISISFSHLVLASSLDHIIFLLCSI